MPESYVLLDTSTMPLEEVPGNPGARRRSLLEVPDLSGFVRIVYGPPGFSSSVRELLEHGAHRHYHRSVTERHYVLAGDYPIWHWIDATRSGEMTRLRRHHYLENPPRTLHGIVPGSVPDTGYAILQWTDGFGTELFEPGAETETITLGPDAVADPAGFRRPVLFNAEESAWGAHASVAAWRTRALGTETETCPVASLVNIPAGWQADADRQPLIADHWLWLLVISGDLTVRAGGAPGSAPAADRRLALREGSFLAWPPGAAVPLEAGTPSTGGCVVLGVGHDLAAVSAGAG